MDKNNTTDEELNETLYLLANPYNAARLEESFKQAENKEFVEIVWDNK